MDGNLPNSDAALHSSNESVDSDGLGAGRPERNLTPPVFSPSMTIWFRHVYHLPKLNLPKLVVDPYCCAKDLDYSHSARVSSWAIDRFSELSGSFIDADGWSDIYSPYPLNPIDATDAQPRLPSAMSCLVCGGVRSVHEFTSHLFKHACTSSPIMVHIGLNSQSGDQLKSAIRFIPLTCKSGTYSVYWLPTEFVLSKYFTNFGRESLYQTPADPKDLFYLYLLRYYSPEAINCFKIGLPPALC